MVDLSMKLARFDIGMGPRTALVMGEHLMELTSLDVVRCEIDQIGAIENHVVAQGA